MRRIEESGEVTFGQAIKDFIQGWVSYGGRATRAGYWWAILGVVLYVLAGMVLSFMLMFTVRILGVIFICLLGISSIFVLIEAYALLFRRFRDVGFKTAPIVIWLLCYFFVPFVNAIAGIAGLVFMFLPTDQFVAEKENWLVRGKDTVDETQTTAAQPQLTKAAPATAASPSLPTVVFYPDGREQEVK